MSLYNALFGMNPYADILLAFLDLDRARVGRFRDVFVDTRPNGERCIVVHTRNGGGNRGCWHENDPKWGDPECKHRVEQEEVDEVREVRNGVLVRYERTGRRVIADRYVCEEPDSPACACPGCTIVHRLPRHPLYLFDRDDDFDSTYADIYFRVPEAALAATEAIASESNPGNPAERWQAMFRALESGDPNDPAVQRALAVGRQIIERPMEALKREGTPVEIEGNE